MKKILVVEDEKNIRRSIAEILRISGYTVFEAENGKQAFEIINESDFKIFEWPSRKEKSTL